MYASCSAGLSHTSSGSPDVPRVLKPTGPWPGFIQLSPALTRCSFSTIGKRSRSCIEPSTASSTPACAHRRLYSGTCARACATTSRSLSNCHFLRLSAGHDSIGSEDGCAARGCIRDLMLQPGAGSGCTSRRVRPSIGRVQARRRLAIGTDAPNGAASFARRLRGARRIPRADETAGMKSIRAPAAMQTRFAADNATARREPRPAGRRGMRRSCGSLCAQRHDAPV